MKFSTQILAKTKLILFSGLLIGFLAGPQNLMAQDASSHQETIKWSCPKANAVTIVRVADLWKKQSSANQKMVLFESLQDLGIPNSVSNYAKCFTESARYSKEGEIKQVVIGSEFEEALDFQSIAKQYQAKTKKKNKLTFFDDLSGFRTYKVSDHMLASVWPKSPLNPTKQNSLLKKGAAISGDIILGFSGQDFLGSTEDQKQLVTSLQTNDHSVRTNIADSVNNLEAVFFSLTVRENPVFEIRLDFRKKLNLGKTQIEKMMDTVHSQLGFDIPGYGKRKILSGEKSIRVRCKPTKKELYILGSSFFPIRETDQGKSDASFSNPQNDDQVDKGRTKRWILKMDKTIRRLGRIRQKGTANLFYAHVLEKEAEKIRRQNFEKMDSNVIQFAEKLHNRFRKLSLSLQRQESDIQTLNRSITTDLKEIQGGWVWGHGLSTRSVVSPTIRGGQNPNVKIQSNVKNVREKQSKIVVQERGVRRKIWEEIWKLQYKTRSELRVMYGSNYLKPEPIR